MVPYSMAGRTRARLTVSVRTIRVIPTTQVRTFPPSAMYGVVETASTATSLLLMLMFWV
jgi:hypothetical protein